MNACYWKRMKLALLLAATGAAALLGGCGKKVDVKIQDGYTETHMAAAARQTVGEALSEAEIIVGKGDQVTPGLEEPLGEGTKEITILRQAKVQVYADGKEEALDLTGKKVKDALLKTGVSLGKHDIVNHEPDAYLTDGMSIQVIRRLAVSLTADGSTKKYITEAKTVKELLDAQNLSLGKHDRVKPKLSSKLSEGTKVTVKRVDVKKVTETVSIPYQTQTTNSNKMTVGSSKVTREGKDGEKEVTYQVTYVDGKEESRKSIKEKVVKKPVDKLVTRGTKPKGKTIVSKERVEDCDGSGHGYYIITYSDGTVKYVDF